jgi:hypothetical protein
MLFLHRQMVPSPGEGPVDLVLTPQYYLMKREEIPLRFAFQARKLAPSLFEENHSSEEPTRYEVLRNGESWLYFAYHPEEIREALMKAQVDPGRIRRLYFAQQFASLLDRPVLLPGGEEALVLLDDTVTLLPARMLPEEPSSHAEELPRPSESFRFSFEGTESKINRKAALVLSGALLILGLGWVLEGFRYHRAATAEEKRLEKVLEAHPTLRSRLTRENIYNKYHAVDRRQRQLRRTVRAIGTLVSKDSKLDSLAIDEKGYRATLSAQAKKLQTLRELADDAGLPAKISSGKKLEIRGSWK